MWRSLPDTVSTLLNVRQGFTATGVGHEVIVFGGDDNNKTTNQLLLLDTKKEKLLQFGDMFHRKVHTIFTNMQQFINRRENTFVGSQVSGCSLHVSSFFCLGADQSGAR